MNKKRYNIIIVLLISISLGSVLLYLNFSKKATPANTVNVILITIDCLRPDHLGCYGYKKNISPNIDNLAKEGVMFTQAIAQASWTAPSIISIATSTYPSTHKKYFWDNVLSPKISSLARILKGNRYNTYFCSGHGSELFPGLQKDFDKFNIVNNKFTTAKEINKLVLGFLEENKKNKFFIWIHYMDAHDHLVFLNRESLDSDFFKENIEKCISKYDKVISSVDSHIKILLDKLRELGLYKNTVVIISADHGEEMCEHDTCFSHGGILWDTIIKVPLIIFYPRLLPKNKIISQQVQHIDIAPTVCDILRIKNPNSFEGKSLLPLIEGSKFHPIYAFSEHKENEGDVNEGRWIYSKYSIRTSDWKLIKTVNEEGEEYELYNLRVDPQETNNLIEIEKEQFRFLKTKLEKWMNRPRINISPLTKPLDEAVKERLKGFGYLQ